MAYPMVGDNIFCDYYEQHDSLSTIITPIPKAAKMHLRLTIFILAFFYKYDIQIGLKFVQFPLE